MNATAPPDLIEVTDYHDGSDSDTNIDDAAADEYYQPVSAVDSEDEDLQYDDAPTHPQPLDNGATVNEVQGGISALRLNGHVVDRDASSDDDEDEEAAAAAEDAESAMARAVREDENRRRAALTAENRARVLEAMQGVSFAGAPPSWAGRVSGEALVARLRALGSSTRN